MFNQKNYSNENKWQDKFKLPSVGILIVCRGPIRLEALEEFKKVGARCGILLSEKDSVTYTHTLAPELRFISNEFVHRISDYIGTGNEERKNCIKEIINIAKKNNYDYIFAGYGFMSEDADFVTEIENAGLKFIGPSSNVHKDAGAKDKAKIIARNINVSVTPGIDNISALTLVEKAKNSKENLTNIAIKNLNLPNSELKNFQNDDINIFAENLLQESYKKGLGLITLEELKIHAKKEGAKLLIQNPKFRLRLKYIGGGGGKGQRIVSKEEEITNAVVEILSEAKVLGDNDNKNFLLELNIENIRHNEIQLLGNGDWCVALGGRDCSLQIYEQKLVELSISDELFEYEIQQASIAKNLSLVKVLETDRKLLADMEAQAVRFAQAVKLNSASTFETIVSENKFFFMEMNTRIQVEHRVSEMIYSLRFINPENKNEFFDVTSYLHAMLLVAVYGKNLPCPIRIQTLNKFNEKNNSGGEVRLNAQNEALQPSAGGLIEYWSSIHKKEIRDDQGLSLLDPDTKDFIRYYLAGAYDSNIALIISYAANGRKENLENLSEILRTMELRGQDLQTNKNFHYGIINFCLGLNYLVKPNTYFVQPYLCAVGNLGYELNNIDLDFIWTNLIRKKINENFGVDGLNILNQKQNLILRPLKKLQKNPHLSMGYLIRNFNITFKFEKEKVIFLQNPLFILRDLYRFLNLDHKENNVPINNIWEEDKILLENGLEYYKELFEIYSISDYCVDTLNNNYKNFHKTDFNKEIESTFKKSGNEAIIENILNTHLAWQIGFEILSIFLLTAKKSFIFDFNVDSELKINIPDYFLSAENIKKSLKFLAPPPVASADTIVAQMGGMYYAKETPTSPPLLNKGDHFEKGKAIYIIEVMKMFNKVTAEFSGTVSEVLLDTEKSQIVKKGQPLFKVIPDEKIEILNEEEIKKQIQNNSLNIWKTLYS